jgi:hypothetical protein
VVWVSAALFFPYKIMARPLRQLPYVQQYSIFQTRNRLQGAWLLSQTGVSQT